jgi:hypothetical protein
LGGTGGVATGDGFSAACGTAAVVAGSFANGGSIFIMLTGGIEAADGKSKRLATGFPDGSDWGVPATGTSPGGAFSATGSVLFQDAV